MRFTETGPSIPIELLQKQQQGEAVFFCGAGISMPQLPGFWTLTDQVMNKLGVKPQDRAYKLFHNEITIKQIQQALQEKYPESGELHKTLAALNKSNDTLFDNNVPLDQVFDILQDDYPQYKINKIVHELLNVQKPNTTQHQTILKLSTNSKKNH